MTGKKKRSKKTDSSTERNCRNDLSNSVIGPIGVRALLTESGRGNGNGSTVGVLPPPLRWLGLSSPSHKPICGFEVAFQLFVERLTESLMLCTVMFPSVIYRCLTV